MACSGRSTLLGSRRGSFVGGDYNARLDPLYAVHQLAELRENPGPAHRKAARKALQYLWRAWTWELLAEKKPEVTPPSMG